ncbi:MAG: hypothetical protein NTZ57_01755, partial [Deltaproteobacteria bacterium]|nr:hypothetical protein [Deltaproteobacteria bacterium]
MTGSSKRRFTFTREGLAARTLTATVFLGAFLLFTMEPLLGRLMVPSFGGAVHVWLLCLVFFQFLLLAGYLYAHLWAARFGARHLFLLLLPLINLPLKITAEATPDASAQKLIFVLITQAALPFAVLSTTAVVAQVWLARSGTGTPRNPYPLYSTSNAGSLLGLLSYPLLIEPFLGLRAQGRLWLAGYLLYGVLATLSYILLRPTKATGAGISTGNPFGQSAPPPRTAYALWGLLSALTSAFLLTVTNVIAMEVGSFPLVWIPPLVLYLLSFVLTFREKSGSYGKVMAFWPEILITGGLLYVLSSNNLLMIAGHLLVLFTICLLVHAELYHSRPDSLYLTGFYLAVAAGGAVGGTLVALGAPLLFSGLYEYPLALLALAFILGWRNRHAVARFWRKAIVPVRLLRIVMIAALTGFLVYFGHESLSSSERLSHRNYYGITHVVDNPPAANAPAGVRLLVHSSTLHGIQYLDDPKRRQPALYYHP